MRYVDPAAAKPEAPVVVVERPGAPGIPSHESPDIPPGQSPTLAPVDALHRLEDGNLRFVTERRDRSTATAGDVELRAEVSAGQRPFAAVVACSDSRVAPEVVFDQALGDLFVVRNAGNVAEPVGEGSLEYAVEELGVSLVVVLGHESCGAVRAVVASPGALPGNLEAIQREMPGLHAFAAEHAKAGATESAVVAAAVEHNAAEQARALLVESAVIARAALDGRIIVVPAVYSLTTGKVDFLDAVRPTDVPGADAAGQ
jgi:carbonic anhydrase